MKTITKAKASATFFAAQRTGDWRAAAPMLAAFFTPQSKNGPKRWPNSLATARQGLGVDNPVIQTVFADGYGHCATRWQHRSEPVEAVIERAKEGDRETYRQHVGKEPPAIVFCQNVKHTPKSDRPDYHTLNPWRPGAVTLHSLACWEAGEDHAQRFILGSGWSLLDRALDPWRDLSAPRYREAEAA